jgi:hypothetical protein
MLNWFRAKCDQVACRPVANRVLTGAICLSLIHPHLALPQTAATGAPANSGGAASATTAKPAPLPKDAGWPRVYKEGEATVYVHQPQVDDWKEFKVVQARSAVEIQPKKDAKKIIAAMHWEAQTDADLQTRTVLLRDLKITSFRIPGQDEATTKTYQDLVARVVPKRSDAVALDRVLAYLDPNRVPRKEVKISTEPPTILVSTKPAILVMLDGQPLLADVKDTKLSYIINTNWDLLKEKDDNEYYLLNGTNWLQAEQLDGPYKSAKKLPKEFSKIPANDNWTDVRKAMPIAKDNKDKPAPQVFVTYKPAELILLEGEPRFQPVAGTVLSDITNTKSLLFYHNGEKNYYFLVSGRWFRNQMLRGVWEYCSDKLPEDFKKFPASHPKAAIRASVPGTIEAADAVLLASVPQVGIVNRKQAAAEAKATYIGAPQFKPIQETSLEYAVNTPADVIKFQNRYYLLQQGVWFTSGSAEGPWEVADKVPEEIYKIPPESPKHNTTYVYITDSDSETVTTAQTAGYMGVAIGVGITCAVWGTGYYYPPYYYWGPMYPYPIYWGYPYYSYGAAAWYNPVTGFYGRGGVAYGPYGGYGRAAAYNPATGGYVRRAGAWGPYQGAMGTSFYNPRTGTWGGGYRYANGYQGWGQGVVHRGDQWARGGYYYDDRGAVGGIRNSEGGGMIAAGNGDNRGMVARTSDGDLYVGKDGDIYRRDQNGNWQQRGDGSWNNINYDNLSADQKQRVDQAKSKVAESDRATQARNSRSSDSGARASTREAGSSQLGANRGSGASQLGSRAGQPGVSTRDARPSRDTMSGLDRDASARSRGNQNYGSWDRNTSRSTGSGLSRGGGARMGGGRRR